jgi:DNA-binding response OmpR family regulator
LVDDDPAVRRMLVRVLDEENYSVRPASTGAEALAVAADGDFKVLLLDGDLPGEDVGHLCERFTRAYPDLPIIIMVRSNHCVEPSSSSIGVCLEKPLDMRKLIRAVGELVSGVEQAPPRVITPPSATPDRSPSLPSWKLKPSPIS